MQAATHGVRREPRRGTGRGRLRSSVLLPRAPAVALHRQSIAPGGALLLNMASIARSAPSTAPLARSASSVVGSGDGNGSSLCACPSRRVALRCRGRCQGDVAWHVPRGRSLGSSAEHHTGDGAAREALLLPRPSGSHTLHCLSGCLSLPTRRLTALRQSKLTRREACRRSF